MAAVDIKLTSEVSRTEISIVRTNTADTVVEAVALLLYGLQPEARTAVQQRLGEIERDYPQELKT
jgi:hypothetical protein